jgi:hypothetical protein
MNKLCALLAAIFVVAVDFTSRVMSIAFDLVGIGVLLFFVKLILDESNKKAP